MGRPKENAMVLSFPIVDIGNTAANVAAICVPSKCVVMRLVCSPMTAAANSFTISVDSLSNGTQGAEDIGKIIVPDSKAAGAGTYDLAGQGVQLNAGDVLLLQVDEAGDSGEKGCVSVLVEYEPEEVANQSNLTITA